MKKRNVCMLTPIALAVLMAGFLTCRAADTTPSAEAPAHQVSPANYVLRVEWKSSKGDTSSLQLVTAEGTFKLQTSMPAVGKTSDSDVPVSVSVDGDLQALNPHQGRLRFFLGRSVPFVIRAGSASSGSTIQQRQEGLTSTFLVTFGKPVVIQKDANGEVSVLVEREKP